MDAQIVQVQTVTDCQPMLICQEQEIDKTQVRGMSLVVAALQSTGK